MAFYGVIELDLLTGLLIKFRVTMTQVALLTCKHVGQRWTTIYQQLPRGRPIGKTY